MSGQPFASVISQTLMLVADFLCVEAPATAANTPSARIRAPAARMFRAFIDDLPKASIDGLQSDTPRSPGRSRSSRPSVGFWPLIGLYHLATERRVSQFGRCCQDPRASVLRMGEKPHWQAQNSSFPSPGCEPLPRFPSLLSTPCSKTADLLVQTA